MIKLTRLNGKQFWLNEELIEMLEETPDVVLTLTNGHKYVVKEAASVVNDLIAIQKQQLQSLQIREEE